MIVFQDSDTTSIRKNKGRRIRRGMKWISHSQKQLYIKTDKFILKSTKNLIIIAIVNKIIRTLYKKTHKIPKRC